MALTFFPFLAASKMVSASFFCLWLSLHLPASFIRATIYHGLALALEAIAFCEGGKREMGIFILCSQLALASVVCVCVYLEMSEMVSSCAKKVCGMIKCLSGALVSVQQCCIDKTNYSG
jgi:hypothetical protein